MQKRAPRRASSETVCVIVNILKTLMLVWVSMSLPFALIMRDGMGPGSVTSCGMEAIMRMLMFPLVWPALIAYVVLFVVSLWFRRRSVNRCSCKTTNKRRVVACAVEILLVCLLVFLLGRLFWGRVSDPPCGRSAVPLIDGRGLPIRDFKWDELRLGDVAGMEDRYLTRIGKVFSPSGGVAPKVDVAKYMKELRLPAVSFRPPATLADALLYLQSASAPFDGSGRVVLFALMPKEEGKVYPTVPEMSAEDISFADILRLVCESTDARYVIRDDGVVVVWPPDFCCECNYMPGEEWRLPIGTWPRRSSFVEGCRGKVFRQD